MLLNINDLDLTTDVSAKLVILSIATIDGMIRGEFAPTNNESAKILKDLQLRSCT